MRLFYFNFPRFAGFSPLILSWCNSTGGDIRELTINDAVDTDAFLNPIALLVCYYTLAITSRFILDRKVSASVSYATNAFHQLILTEIATHFSLFLTTNFTFNQIQIISFKSPR